MFADEIAMPQKYISITINKEIASILRNRKNN